MLAAGTRLGQYEIVSLVGAGGMGSVYRARDSHLHRTVAIKVLSGDAATAASGDLLLHEARAASALNHPNICTVHEVREENGLHFIVMECVEGRPLNQLIPPEGLPVDSAVRYGIQIADALAHAHERGVLHRDLKSANVIVSRDGRVKIVDFGLARRFVPVGSEAATRSEQLIQPPRSAGTLAYMAPELLRGDQPAVATDVWALGVLLYEMTTGHLPFTGRTVFEEAAQIFRSPMPAMPAHVPASVRTIIARCLAREPEQRYQSPREVASALEAVHSGITSIASSGRLGPRAAASRRPWIAVVAAIAIAAAAVAWWRVARRPAPRSGREQLAQLLASDRPVGDPALSLDGTMIAYTAEDETGRTDLFVSRVAGGRPIRLTNDDLRETHPRFSPDGERIAFSRRRLDGTGPDTCTVAALGGEISMVLASAGQPSWSPDGRRLAFVRYADQGRRLSLATATIDGGDVRDLVVSGAAAPFIRSPAWSPDGRFVAFVQGAGGVAAEIWIATADGTGAPRRLSNDPPAVYADDPVFAPDGRTIVHTSNRGGAQNIWALPVNGAAPTRLTNGAGPDESPTVDAQGRVAFVNSRWRSELFQYDFATGSARTLVRHTPFVWAPAFHPSDPVIAFSRGEIDGAWHIWLVDADGQSMRQLTNTDRGEVYPRWTPDGASLIYHTWAGPHRVWRVPRGGGPPAPLTPESIDAAYGDVSPDGASLVFAATESSSERLYVMRMGTSTVPRLLRTGTGSVPRWSPDGRWIAFAPDRGFFGGIHIIGADGTGERKITNVGGWPAWASDGRRILYSAVRADGNEEVRTASIDPDARVDPRPLPIRFVGNNNPFDISRDGRTLASSTAVHVSSEIWVLSR